MSLDDDLSIFIPSAVQRLLGVNKVESAERVHRVRAQLTTKTGSIHRNLFLCPTQLRRQEPNGTLCVILQRCTKIETHLLVLLILGPLRYGDLGVRHVLLAPAPVSFEIETKIEHTF